MTIPEHMTRFVIERDLCVLSTSSPQAVPHASLMSYAAQADLEYIFMATPASSRKWANLTANPNMAILIDDRDQAFAADRSQTRALTIGGVNDPPQDASGKQIIRTLLRKMFPHLGHFLAGQDIEIIRFKPRWFLLLTGAEQSVFIDLEKY